MSLTVAIPFHNTSEFFLETVRTPLSCNYVTEIVISDDNSKEEEFNNLLNLVKNINSPKIKVFRNDSNYGAYVNKYIAVSKSSNKWIYLLDSDNFVHENNIEKFFNENLNDNVCYLPNKYNFCSYIYELTLGFEELDKTHIQDAIRNNTIGHMVNLGNFFVEKDKYMERMEEGISNNMDNVADCATMTYLWLKNGGKFKVIKDFFYYHRVRENGYYEVNKASAENCVNYYYNNILQL